MNVTRRHVLSGVASAAALALTPVRVAGQAIEHVFRIQDSPRNPTMFTYDMFAWAGDGYLAFRDGENDIARWGDDNPPPTTTPGGAAGNPLFDDLVDADLYDNLVNVNLYGTLVRTSSTLTTPLVIAVFAILALFGFLATKMRSVILATVWLFMGLTFVLAVLVDLSLTYFWVSVVFGFFATIGAIVEGSR